MPGYAPSNSARRGGRTASERHYVWIVLIYLHNFRKQNDIIEHTTPITKNGLLVVRRLDLTAVVDDLTSAGNNHLSLPSH